MSGLGRKEWSPGDVLTSADVNGYLMDQSVMVFAGTAARASAIPTPSAGMVAYSTATSLQVYHNSDWSDVGSQKVLQIVTAHKTDTFTTASTSFVDLTGLSANITPISTSSTILVGYAVQGQGLAGANMGSLQIVRGATAIGNADAAGSRTVGNAVVPEFGSAAIGQMTNWFMDSPATTSLTTYKLQIKTNAPGTVYVNRTVTDSNLAAYSRGTSSFVIMEISA